jgi:hypothetical protein
MRGNSPQGRCRWRNEFKGVVYPGSVKTAFGLAVGFAGDEHPDDLTSFVDKAKLTGSRNTLPDVRESKATMNSTCATGGVECGGTRVADLQLDFRLLSAFPAVNQDPIVAAANERKVLGVEQRFHLGPALLQVYRIDIS